MTRYQPKISEADQNGVTKAPGLISSNFSQTMLGEATSIRDSAILQLLAGVKNAEAALSADFLANTASLSSPTPAPSYSPGL